MMNKQSGMLALCGYSDNRDIEAGYLSGNEKCILATKTYVHALLKYIGAYIAVLGGVDAIVFTAGVGEHGVIIRQLVMEHLSYLGIKPDYENNKLHATEVMISTPDSKVKVFVIPTDEELVIAQDTMHLALNK